MQLVIHEQLAGIDGLCGLMCSQVQFDTIADQRRRQLGRYPGEQVLGQWSGHRQEIGQGFIPDRFHQFLGQSVVQQGGRAGILNDFGNAKECWKMRVQLFGDDNGHDFTSLRQSVRDQFVIAFFETSFFYFQKNSQFLHDISPR